MRVSILFVDFLLGEWEADVSRLTEDAPGVELGRTFFLTNHVYEWTSSPNTT